MRLGKKAFTWGVVASTIAWSVGIAALPLSASALSLSSGALIKGSLPAVYYYASNGKRYVFPNQQTFNTWFADFSSVQVISDADLASISIGGNVTYRAGTRMVKIQSDPKAYAVEPGGKLRWVTSEAIAIALWGSAWASKIDDVSDAFFTNYSSGTDVTSNAYPTGALIKTAASPDVWYVEGATKRKVTSAGFTANNFRNEFVVTTSLDVSGLVMGADITGNETALWDVAQVGGAGPVTPAASGLSVSAAADNPSGASIVTDNNGNSTGDGAQALIGALKVRFMASADGAVTVNTVKIARGGISADGDLQEAYLFDGDGFGSLITKSNSISNGMITFSNAGGLFTVPAGGFKDVYFRFDLTTLTSAGKTLSFSLAAANVTTSNSSTAVSGSAAGNTFTVASVTDLGQLELASVNPSATTTVDPQNDYELWRFKVDANDNDMLIKSIMITNAGSIGSNDIQNLELWDGATMLGAAVPTLVNNHAMFDLAGMTNGGLKLTAGQSKQLALRGDIISGTNRTFRFSIRDATDVVAYDTDYNIFTRPVKDNTETFSVIEPNNAGTAVDATISTGKLTIQKTQDSPSTNVPDGASNVLLAKFNFTASGEDVKVNSLPVNCSMNTTTDLLLNMKLIFDGSQVGTTDASQACDGATEVNYTFGNSFVVPAGATKTLEVRADLTDATVGANDTILINLEAPSSSNAEGRVSLQSITTSASSGNTATVKAGVVVTSEDSSFTDRTSTLPTGVLGAQGASIGQFVVTGGGEDSDITQIVLTDDVSASNMSPTFQNLKLWVVGSNGVNTQVGTTVSSLTNTSATTYTFTPNTPIRVVAGGSKVFIVTADIKTGGTALTADGVVKVSKVSATGVTTGSDTSDSDGTNAELQNVYIATNGGLSIYPDSSTPIRAIQVLGATGLELGRFVLKADQNEDINVTKLVISDVMTGGGATGATGTLKNIKLIDAASGAQYGGTVASLDSSSTGSTNSGAAIFDNIASLVVPKNNSISLKVVADLTSYTSGGVSSSSHRLAIQPSYVGGVDNGTTSGSALSIAATGKDSGFSISGSSLDFNGSSTNSNTDTLVYANYMDVFRTKLTIAKSQSAPSGLTAGQSEQTVAMFVVTNTANVDNQTATIKRMNADIGSTISNTAARAIKFYKDDRSSASNVIASTTTPCFNTASTICAFSDTNFTEANFTDVDVGAGNSRTIWVTMDTSDAASQKNLTVGLDAGQATPHFEWTDGVTSSITMNDSLPLSGNTLTY